MKNPVRVTSRHIVMNPVARAVAQAKLIDAVRTFRIRMHLLAHNELVLSDMLVLDMMFHITLHAGGADPVIRGAHSAIKQCIERKGAWHTQDLIALDEGLGRLVEMYPKLNPRAVAAAWQTLKVD